MARRVDKGVLLLSSVSSSGTALGVDGAERAVVSGLRD